MIFKAIGLDFLQNGMQEVLESHRQYSQQKFKKT